MNILRCRQTKLEDKQTFCNDREKLLYFKHERNRGDEIQVVSNLRLYLMNTNLLVCNLWLYQIMVVAHDVCGKSGSLPQQSTRKSPPKIKQKSMWIMNNPTPTVDKLKGRWTKSSYCWHIHGICFLSRRPCEELLHIFLQSSVKPIELFKVADAIGSFRLFVASFQSGWVLWMWPKGVGQQHR